MNKRIMFAATSSGSGKTTITCGFLKILKNKGLKISAFKCGPDYIDTMFHSKVLGIKSKNLDLFFTDENKTKGIFLKNSMKTDISVIEGVMGYYDGLGGTTDIASSYHIASVLDIPVILILDAKKLSFSIAAIIKGFILFREKNNIKGIILNRCSEMMFKGLKNTLEKETGLKVLGFLPEIKDISFESRHLGLITADEILNINYKLDILAKQMIQSIDIDEILNISENVSNIDKKYLEEIKIKKITKKDISLAVAYDKSICFYYEDNFDILEKMGVKIIKFSPIEDEKIPDTDGLYIGGGYPELYLKELSNNKSMLKSIMNFYNSKKPIVAECGGFMYLQSLIDNYKMVDIIDGNCFSTPKLQHFGYVKLTCLKDNILCKKNDFINAHEFHYWNSDNCGNSFDAIKPISKRKWNCIYTDDNVFAGYPHLYFYSNLCFAENFVKAMERVKA